MYFRSPRKPCQVSTAKRVLESLCDTEERLQVKDAEFENHKIKNAEDETANAEAAEAGNEKGY